MTFLSTNPPLVRALAERNYDRPTPVQTAVLAGGCPAIEMTFTVPGAHRVIEELAAA